MLECLDGLVYLDDTCAGESGVISLQTLGINETFLSRIVGPEQDTKKLLANVRDWARAYLHNDAINAHSRNIIARTFIDRERIGRPTDNDTLITATAGTIGGIVIEVDNPTANTVLRIGSASFYGNTTGAQTFTIYDLQDGSTVATFSMTLVAGQVTTKALQVTLPAYREKKRYFITHAMPASYEMTIAPGGCNACGQKGYVYGGAYIYGARIGTGLPKRYSNLQRVSDTSGLGLVVTLECDHAQWLCESADVFALPYAYLIARGIMDAAIAQEERMNPVTEGEDTLVERKKQYEFEYTRSMENAVKNMAVPADKLCFSCNNKTYNTVVLP